MKNVNYACLYIHAKRYSMTYSFRKIKYNSYSTSVQCSIIRYKQKLTYNIFQNKHRYYFQIQVRYMSMNMHVLNLVIFCNRFALYFTLLIKIPSSS